MNDSCPTSDFSFRGSIQYSDLATDIQCEILDETRTHEGFEKAAAWFDQNLKSIVVFLRRSFPDYKLALCGHSLGGAVASLLCMRWLRITDIAGPAPTRPMLKAYSFGAPCVCTRELSSNFNQHIISVRQSVSYPSSWFTPSSLLVRSLTEEILCRESLMAQ